MTEQCLRMTVDEPSFHGIIFKSFVDDMTRVVSHCPQEANSLFEEPRQHTREKEDIHSESYTVAAPQGAGGRNFGT